MERLFYTASEATEVLGTNPNVVQALLNAGEIPAYKEGRNWKIPKSLLQKYIEERAVSETAERRRNAGDR